MIGIIIQARTSSSRLPRKVFMDLNGKYSIQRMLEGCKKTIMPHKIILAMPKSDEDEIKSRIANGELGPYIDDRFELFIHEGELNNVLDRYYLAARKYGLKTIMRLTADCPMHCGSSKILDEMLMEYQTSGTNGYMCNNFLLCTSPYPLGISSEVFSYEALCYMKERAVNKDHLEHVTCFMYDGSQDKFPIIPFENTRPHTKVISKISSWDFCLDTSTDYSALLRLTDAYDKCLDLNSAYENVDMIGVDESNYNIKKFKK